MKAEDITHVLILGSGNMGQQIGFQCAACGLSVTLHDVNRDVLDNALDRMGKLARNYVRNKRLTQQESEEALDRIHPETDPVRAGEEADFVSESVPEDPELKGQVFASFHQICPPRTIFTTNTSSLIPSMFAESTGRPDRFAAFHFHDVRYNTIVDIMPHPGTSRETLDLIEAFARRIHQTPIRLHRESHGYVFNAMFMDFLRAAQKLAANNVASIEDIDRSWMGVMQTNIGPFGFMDSIGIDTVYKIADYWARQQNDPEQRKVADFLKEYYVDQEYLGVKTGKGFYTYPDPAFARPGFIQKENQEESLE